MELVHKFSSLFPQSRLFFFRIYPEITDKLRQDRLNNWNGLGGLHVFFKVSFSCILNTVSGQQLSFLIILNFKWILLENPDYLSDRKFFLLLIEDCFEESFFWYPFKRDKIVQIFGDLFYLLESDSLDPFLLVGSGWLFDHSEYQLLSGFIFLFILLFHLLQSGL